MVCFLHHHNHSRHVRHQIHSKPSCGSPGINPERELSDPPVPIGLSASRPSIEDRLIPLHYPVTGKEEEEMNMVALSRLKNRAIAKLATGHPSLGRKLADTFSPIETEGIPWTPVNKSLSESVVAIATTAGVHERHDIPFDMEDREGDPTFRVIHADRSVKDLMITHDYYDHSDADRDINIVFPLERLRELEKEGIIGKVADRHYGFMGHILGRHIPTLINRSAPGVARRLKEDRVDVLLLTPG